jgi:hypothetical protein
VTAGRIAAIQAGVFTIRRDDGTTFSFRPHFVAGAPDFRLGERVAFERGRIWKIATAPAVQTK